MKEIVGKVRPVLLCVLIVLFPALVRSQGDGLPDEPPLPPGAEWIAVDKAFSEFPDLNREAVLAFIRTELAEEYAECKALSVRRLSQAIELMTRLVADAAEFLEAKEQNPGLYNKLKQKRQLEQQVLKLAETCRQSPVSTDQSQIDELRRKLTRVFELKQEFMKSDVDRMAEDLDALKALIAEREARRDGIVDRRLSELLGEAESLKW